MIYAGVGSRRTPQDVQDLMCELAGQLASEGWTLRSGHAEGADLAFEKGADGKAEIYLPWPEFNSHEPCQGHAFPYPSISAIEMGRKIHPRGRYLSHPVARLMGRNCHQILGPNLNEPVALVFCWTPDGSLDGQGPNTGGTGQAIRLAVQHDIPVYNLARADHRELVRKGCHGTQPS